MKRYLAISIIILAAVGIIILMAAHYHQAQAQLDYINLSVDPKTVSAGENFDVDVQINAPATQLFKGWEFDLAFDPKLLKLNSVKEGSLFSRCHPATTTATSFFVPGRIDNAAGTLTGVAEAGLGQGWTGCCGAGVIATLNFTALGNGTPVYTLSNVLLADPNAKYYNLYQYSLSGALRQTVDPAGLSTQVAEATQQAFNIFNSAIYKHAHHTPSPDEIAAGATQAYFNSHQYPRLPPATPVYDPFQTPEDILKLIPTDPFFNNGLDPHDRPCVYTGVPGTPVFVKSVDAGADYYLIPFREGSWICGVAEFYVPVDGKGTFEGYVSGNGPSGEKLTINYLLLTSDEAKSLVEKAGFSVLGEPRLVYKDCDGCTDTNPPWEITTTDGQTLYVVYDFTPDTNAPVILTPNGIIKP
ncbi:MAG: cohesin domain-containing protein [Anaerolineales bacterium]